MIRIRVWIVFLAVSCGACAVPLKDAPGLSIDEPSHTIYLVSHGWHAGIVLRRDEVPDSVWSLPGDFHDEEYLEVGWGDMDYYQTPGAHIGVILKAALLPTDSVLHIVGFNGSVQAYFPYSEIIGIKLSSSNFENLSRAIAASFFRNEADKTISLGRGLYGNSHF